MDEPNVLPAVVPSQADLWDRNQLARSLLSHRPPSEATTREVLAILEGAAEPQSPGRTA